LKLILKIGLLILIFNTLSFCHEEPFSEPRDYPVIRTLSVSNINSSGATFNAEFLNLGTNDIKVFGFAWDINIPGIEYSDTIIINEKPKIQKYSVRIDNGLGSGLKYKVTAFACTNNYLIYGNVQEFNSLGSQFCPWSFLFADILRQGCYCLTNEDICLIINRNSFRQYINIFKPGDISTTLISISNSHELDPIATSYIVSFSIENTIYIAIDSKSSFYKLDNSSLVDHPRLIKLNSRPDFTIIPGAIGFTINNYGYLISSYGFYRYDAVLDSWEELKAFPGGTIIEGVAFDNNAYILSSTGELFIYNPTIDDWFKISQYPGAIIENSVGFAGKKYIYFGLGYNGDLKDRNIWGYNPIDNIWVNKGKFPEEFYYSTFHFKINDKNYFSYYSGHNWRFFEFISE
jgi:hypothetical protein